MGGKVAAKQLSSEVPEYGSLPVRTTVTGYKAWALMRLAQRNRQALTDVASYVLNRWVDENVDYLSQFGISQAAFDAEVENKVVSINPNDA